MGIMAIVGPSRTSRARRRVALIQGSIDTDMKTDPASRSSSTIEYLQLSADAVAAAAHMQPKHDVRFDRLAGNHVPRPLISFDPTSVPPGAHIATERLAISKPHSSR